MSALATVIIPAFNAARTLAATIASAQQQTLRELEILVIDDGSRDATPDIACEAARHDSRIRVIRRANAGVAAARNAAIEQATGTFIAPLDADDIWHPEKLERQVAALRAAPAGTGLAYNWYRRIDAEDIVRAGSPAPIVEGSVLHRHLEWNFISNGSNLMVPSEIARRFGYAAPVAGPGQQGAEDYLFQLRIARHYRFVCVPAWLTGYRVSAGGLSTKVATMLRAHLAMYALIEAEEAAAVPTIGPVIARRLAQLRVELARNRLRRGAVLECLALICKALAGAPGAATGTALGELRKALALGQTRTNAQPPFRRFADYGPSESDGPWQPLRSAALLAWLARLDAAA